MDWFHFPKVYTVMIALDWVWASVGGVPTVPQLKEWARNYLVEAVSLAPGESIGSGGFVAHKRIDGNLYLEFVLEDWAAGGD